MVQSHTVFMIDSPSLTVTVTKYRFFRDILICNGYTFVFRHLSLWKISSVYATEKQNRAITEADEKGFRK